jgi:hypothetical protein
MEPAIPPTSIHHECFGGKPLKALSAEMLSLRHCSNYSSERQELILLAAQ